MRMIPVALFLMAAACWSTQGNAQVYDGAHETITAPVDATIYQHNIEAAAISYPGDADKKIPQVVRYEGMTKPMDALNEATMNPGIRVVPADPVPLDKID
jgi:hypothetical protein